MNWLIGILGLAAFLGGGGFIWQASRRQAAEAHARETEARLIERDDAIRLLRGEIADLADAADQAGKLRAALDTDRGESRRLRDAAEQAAKLLDAAPFPIWRRDADGKLIWVNARSAELAEASPADTVARGIEFTAPRDPETARALALRAAAARQALTEERRFVAEGDRRNYRVTEVPLPDGFLGFGQDITAEADARGQLKRQTEIHFDVLRSLSTATAIFGTDKRLLLWNRAYARLWDLEESWLEQRPSYGEVLEHLRAQRRLPEQIDWQAYKRSQQALFTSVIDQIEELIHLPDGSALRLSVSAYPAGGLLFAYDDVTRQLSLERATNTMIAVQRATLDNLYDAVVVYGPDGKLSLYNRAYAELWQLDPDWLNRKPHITEILDASRDLLLRGGDWAALRTRLLAEFAERKTGQGRMERGDGRVIDHASVPLPDGSMLLTYMDVTDSIRIERALRDRNETLERTDRMNAGFIANITHELRSPLGTLISMTEVLSQGILGPMNPRQAEYCADIMENSRHLLRLVDDIIVIARIQVGQMDLEPELYPRNAIWRDDMPGWTDIAERRGLRLELPAADGDCGNGQGDALRLRQALGNVMNAALAGTPQGGLVRLTAQADAEDALLLQVESHSGGLAPIRPTRIFADLAAATEQRRANADLSLLVARGLIELHGGSLRANEADGVQGVTIQLPRDGVAAIAAPAGR